MKILALHCDYLRYRVKDKAVGSAEEPEQREGEVREVLVLFTSFEREDSEELLESAVKEVQKISERVGVRRVFIYPWVHLTENPAPFSVAKKLMERFLFLLKERFEVGNAPIGWYKEFELKVKGHPLSESLRVVREEREEVSPPAEEAEKSEFIVLFPDGREVPIREIDDLERIPLEEEFRILIRNEVFGKEPSGKKPPHIDLMRRLELVDYEPASDVGHFRFYPAGTLVKRLIEEFAFQVAESIGAMEIETPLLYRLDVPAIAEQASKFRERMYEVLAGKTKLILRFAGDFGLFEMMKDMTISYRDLPLSFYEISPSFRFEQRGETVGLRRLRGFTMPDIHTLARDVDQGLEVYKMYYSKYHDLLRGLGLDYQIAFRVVKSFYQEFKPHIVEMLKISGKPALIEILPAMKHYWAMKHEFQFIDSINGNAQLSTVQLDVEDSARYGITYVDERGERKPGIIVHTSMSSIERLMYALLEKAAKDMKRGRRPCFPLWLAPIQVRVIPVEKAHEEYAEKVMKEIESAGIRVDLDDRNLTLSHRVRDSERRWIPYIVIVGDKELEEETISVRRRRDGNNYKCSVKDLISEIKEITKGMPMRPLTLPKRLSRRPVFVGSS